MKKTILVTGATDGIGRETAKALVSLGHHVILHGRNRDRLEAVLAELSPLPGGGQVSVIAADLSIRMEVEAMADAILDRHSQLDVLINNAGVFTISDPRTRDGLDVRFAVNTIAPYRLTQRLLPILRSTSRVVNLSSAAQRPVDIGALTGHVQLPHGMAYAQSKLALTMWTRSMALSLGEDGPTMLAVNPGSMLGTKMVKQAYGVAGADINIGAAILVRAALDEAFDQSGQYFDNDTGRFAPPHPDALDPGKVREVVQAIEASLAKE